MKLHLRSMDDLEEILDRFIVLGQTTTSIIHSSPLAAGVAARRAVPFQAMPVPGTCQARAWHAPASMSEAATTVRDAPHRRPLRGRLHGSAERRAAGFTRLLMLKSDGSVLVHADSAATSR